MIDDLLVEGKRQLDICNSCRYCEGYCAVFPSLERRIDLGKADMVQLANLCHDCRECLYACMYAPPHEFGVNPPQLFAMLRREHADELSRFSTEIKRHERRPLLAGLYFVCVSLVLVLVLAGSTVGLSGLIASHRLAASPYSVLSYPAILAIGMASLALGIVLLVIEGHRFWRASGERARPSFVEIGRAIRSAAVLTNLGGGGEGCAYPSEEGSSARRHAHIAVAWGFSLCLFATIAAAILQDFLGDEPPYGWISVPVLLGLVGGAGLVVGSLALSFEKSRVDPAATDSGSVLREYGFLFALFLLGLGGLVTLLTRTTPIYGIVLAMHLATVFACFVLAPFTKFTHALYRLLALVRDEHERAQERVALGV
ncbi:MAG TPA: tricarballylate utilization 4Fe-4S protein TcuB [Acidimicrobiales bacterium]